MLIQRKAEAISLTKTTEKTSRRWAEMEGEKIVLNEMGGKKATISEILRLFNLKYCFHPVGNWKESHRFKLTIYRDHMQGMGQMVAKPFLFLSISCLVLSPSLLLLRDSLLPLLILPRASPPVTPVWPPSLPTSLLCSILQTFPMPLSRSL